ncbi:MAG TPA: beta-propeller fold lactonase family protein [Steroidobacteraceae bacterium]
MSSIYPRGSRFALLRVATSSLFLGLALAACGGGGSSSTTPPGGGGGSQSYTVGGTISGLSGGGLVLQNNGADNLTVSAGATSFTFKTALATGTGYAVTVMTSPTNPTQACTVSNGTGKVSAANVTNVAISCTSSAYTIGGTVTGLTGTGLVLQNNKGNNLSIAPGTGGAAVSFKFTTAAASGSAYAVTVLTQPTSPAQTCTVTNGSGTVGAVNVTTVAVACAAASYTIGGTVSGLTGTGLVLQDNGGDDLKVAAPTGGTSGTFTFTTPVNAGGAYLVTVKTNPTGPAEVCTVTNGKGTANTANITTVAVTCAKVGQFVFVTNPSDGATGDVAAFTITASTGALAPVAGSPFPSAGAGPQSVVVDTKGQFVYVADRSDDVSTFALPSSGVLTLVTGPPISTPGFRPVSLAVTPTDGYLVSAGYNTGSTGALYDFAITPGTGALTPGPNSRFDIADSSQQQQGVAIDPAGQFVFSTAGSRYIFVLPILSDGTLGPADLRVITDYAPFGVAVWPKGGASGGFVYTANSQNGTIGAFSYDATGNLTAIPPPTGTYFDALGTGTTGIAIDPTGRFLYAANKGTDNVAEYAISTQTGGLTPIGTGLVALTSPVNGGAFGPIDIKVDPSGQFVYVLNTTDGSVSLLSLNATTGALTAVSTYSLASGSGGTALAVF